MKVQLVCAQLCLAYKDQRQLTRDQEVTYLGQIIEDVSPDEATRKTAQETLLQVTEAMEKELIVEGLLEAKGFTEVVTTIQPGSVNVIVGEPKLTDAQVAQILSIVQNETGEATQNIKVIPSEEG